MNEINAVLTSIDKLFSELSEIKTKVESEVWPYNLVFAILGGEITADEVNIKGVYEALDLLESMSTRGKAMKETLILRYKDGLTIQEIAEKESCRCNRVERLLDRGLHLLNIKRRLIIITPNSQIKEMTDRIYELEAQVRNLQEELETMKERVSPRKETRIEVLGLSCRSFNALKKAGIGTVGDLTALSAKEVSEIRDLGILSFAEVQSRLKEVGCDFAKEV